MTDYDFGSPGRGESVTGKAQLCPAERIYQGR